MVDPTKITNYNLTVPELEEHFLFCIAVGGKTAVVMSRCLENLLQYTHKKYKLNGWQPFAAIRCFSQPELQSKMKELGFGCHGAKSRGFLEAANSNLDLKTCSMFDLVKIHSVKYKTANFFLLHTREGHKCAVLDTHILKHLQSVGYNVPKTTPQSEKRYREVQEIFFEFAKGKDLAKLDLELWNKYAKK